MWAKLLDLVRALFHVGNLLHVPKSGTWGTPLGSSIYGSIPHPLQARFCCDCSQVLLVPATGSSGLEFLICSFADGRGCVLVRHYWHGGSGGPSIRLGAGSVHPFAGSLESWRREPAMVLQPLWVAASCMLFCCCCCQVLALALSELCHTGVYLYGTWATTVVASEYISYWINLVVSCSALVGVVSRWGTLFAACTMAHCSLSPAVDSFVDKVIMYK